MTKLLTYPLIIFLLLVNIPCALSQEIYFHKVLPPDGNSFVHVTGMAQDTSGFMWFTTKNGLFRYDGTRMLSFHHDPSDSNSLASDHLEDIAIDPEGNIWLATLGEGLERFDPVTGVFTHFRHMPGNTQSIAHDYITAVLVDQQNKLWIGNSAGLSRMDLSTGHFTHYAYNPSDPHSLSSNEAIEIYEDKNGTIWIGTGSVYSIHAGDISYGGLNRFDRDTEKFTRYQHRPGDTSSLINNKVSAIYEDSRGTFWVGTAGDGLHVMNRQTGRFQRLRYDPNHPEKPSRPPLSDNRLYRKNDHITFITADAGGNVWIGTSESGINYYNPRSGKTIHFSSGRSGPGNFTDRTAWTAFTSNDGLLWLSSIAGNLYKVNISQLNIPFVRIPGALVNAIHQQQNGVIWVGTQNMGLFRMSPEHTILEHYVNEPGNTASLSKNWVSGLAEDNHGRIWVGTHKGLNLYNPNNNSFTRYLHDEGAGNSLPNDWIIQLDTDHNGNLWLCTKGGLVRRDATTGTFNLFTFNSRHSAKKVENGILNSHEDLSGNIWAAFGANDSGVVKLDPQSGNFKIIPIEGVTNHLAIDPVDGNIWMSGYYLTTYDPSKGEIKRFVNASSNQPIRATRSLLIDRQRNLWVCNSDGIIQVDLTRREIVRVFGKMYGVDGEQLAYQVATAGTNGNFYFGSYAGGYYELEPDEIIKQLKRPHLVLTGFRLAGQTILPGKHGPLKTPLAQAETIQLKHFQNIFSFRFAAIDFIDPENNHQYYTLENYDERWNKAGPDSRAFYFKVPPGKYVFKVKAANSNGLWIEKSIAVTVTPPWWWQWWVWALAAVVLITGIYSLARWRMHQKFSARLQRSEQEKELAELRNKTSELEMQALRSQMNPHFIFNSLNSINRFILQNNRLQAAEYLTKFSRLMRLILQNSQASVITLESELEALKLYLDLEVLRFDNRFAYHISASPGLDTEMIKVPPLIIQPFVENAIWHGLMQKEEKGSLAIEIWEEENLLQLKITDDGIGRQQAAALASKTATKTKSMGMALTTGRLYMLQKTNGNVEPVVVNDLVHPDGTAAGTEVIIKIPLRYD